MAEKKITGQPEQANKEQFEKALDTNAEVLKEIETILEEIDDPDFQQEQREAVLLKLGAKVGSIINKINSEEGGQLFDSLRACEVNEAESMALEVEGCTITVLPRLDKMNLYSAISLMSDMMEQEKNRMGYRRFLQMIDEFEFMFFLSFYTNIGYHAMLEGYMKIRDVFDQSGLVEQFYAMIASDRAVAKQAFQRLYDLWKDEHIAMISYLPHAASAGNNLANRILNMLGDELTSEDVSHDVEIQNLLVDMLRKNDGQANQSKAAKSSDRLAPAKVIRPSFQKKKLDDIFDNLVPTENKTE